jgi:Membrane dipeptidase (Peptidase family M19)
MLLPFLIAAVICLSVLSDCRQRPLFDQSLFKEDVYLARAKKLMHQTPLIDGHNVTLPPTTFKSNNHQDLPMLLRFKLNNSIYHDFSFKERFLGDTDLPRLREGLVGGQFWSVFVPWYLSYRSLG